MLGQSVPEGLHPMLEQFVQPGGQTHTGAVNEGLYPVCLRAGAGEDCEEEGTAKKIHEEVDTSPILIPLFYLWERGRGVTSKVQPGKRRGEGKVVSIDFISHCLTLQLTGNKLN